jgi:FkbM family methyltransferase
MKQAVKKFFQYLGYEISRLESPSPGSSGHIVGNMRLLLEDLRSRGFVPLSILDVGANQAEWSRMAKSIFPKANCFLIEPQVEMKLFLEKFCEDFPGSAWFLAGAGAAPSHLTQTIWDDLAGSSFLPGESEELKRLGKQRIVQIITIDSLLDNKEITMPQLVKLDVQGFELEVLRGGQKLFGHTEVFILEISLFKFIEKMPIFHEVISFMSERGYLAYDFPGFLRRPYDGALAQVDICFAKHDGMLRTTNRWE